MPPLRLSLAVSLCFSVSAWGESLVVQGSATVGQVLTAVAPLVKEQLGVELKIRTDGGSSGGITAVGAETAELALSTRPLEASDRATFPERSFDEVQIGAQVVVVAVAADVWMGGVKALTKQQLRGIYEGDIRNWNKVGGPDQPIKFYNLERGRGLWEMFVTWMYGDQRRAPLGKDFEAVTNSKDARDLVEFNAGSMTLVSPHVTDQKGVYALGLKLADDAIVTASKDNLAAQKYPLIRPLIVIGGRRFAGLNRKVVDLLLSPRGQEAVKKADFVPLAEIGAPASGALR